MPGKYETEVNLSNKNNSHTLIVELVGRDKRVLEVGTATGYVSKFLVSSGCEVVGIELDPEAAEQAERYCERVIVGDVESIDLGAELEKEHFDVMVFGDVLEHLKDPLQVLKRLAPFLHQEGYLVASIPNIAHGSVRLALMQGEFRYRRLGLLDDTHLRFFTRKSVEELFNDAGFLIDKLERTKIGIFDTEIEIDRESVTQEVVNLIREDPECRTYQFVLKARSYSDPTLAVRLSNQVSELSDRLQSQSKQLDRKDKIIYESNRKLRNMEYLQQQLDNRSQQLAEREREASELREEVAARNRELTELRRKSG